MLTAIASGVFTVKGSSAGSDKAVFTAHELSGLAAALLDALCCAQPSGTAPVLIRRYAGPDVELRPSATGNSAEDRFCFSDIDWSRAEAVEFVNELYMVGLPAYVAPDFPVDDVPALLGEPTSEEAPTEEVKETPTEVKAKTKPNKVKSKR